VIDLQVALRLETHQRHADLVEILYCFNLLLSDDYFLVADREVGTDLLFVEHLTVLTYELLNGPQLLVVNRVDLDQRGFFCRYDAAVKGQTNL
jgi:hypothetical protein